MATKKKWYTEDDFSKSTHIRQNFCYYRILNNESFKMEVEQTNFVTHVIITVQLYYWLSKNPSVKIWSNKFQIVMINYSKLFCEFIGKYNQRILCQLSETEILRLYLIVHVAMETTKTSNFTCHSKSFISIFFACQVSACELQPFSCKLPKLCSATLSGCPWSAVRLYLSKPGISRIAKEMYSLVDWNRG